MQPDDVTRLRHMVAAAEEALSFVSSRSREDLVSDRMLALAVARAVEIVGEAASRVSADTRAALPRIPWSRIVGMRNRLVHAYLDIDEAVLWTTVTERLPELIQEIKPILPESAD